MTYTCLPRLRCGHRRRVGGKIGVLRQIRPPQHPAQRHELPVIAASDEQVPVAGRKQLIGHDIGVRIAQPARLMRENQLIARQKPRFKRMTEFEREEICPVDRF